MKRYCCLCIMLWLMLSIVCISAYSQETGKKQVAIYVARGDGDQKMISYAKFFASELQLAVSRSAKYNAVERTGKFLELLSREQSYQRTGQVDESKIAELGKQEGVNFVLSVDMTDFGNNSIYVIWKLIDVETAILEDGASEIKEIVNMVVDLKAFSMTLSKRITGGSQVEILNKDNDRLNELNQSQVKMIAALKKQLAESEARIESLQQELASLKNAYAALENINKDNHYEVYWFFGTKNELENWKNFPRSKYWKGDYRNFNTFETHTRDSKNLYLKTHHPSGSYRWDFKDPKNTRIIILDKEKFWSISRYCVIQLK